jgi:hypothetical protein
MPILDDERQHKANQKKVEEVEHIAKRCRQSDLPLIHGQLLLPIKQFEHRYVSLYAARLSVIRSLRLVVVTLVALSFWS